MFLSKIIETKIGNYIYDAVENRIISIPENILEEIKKNISSKNYFKFIEENNCRDFAKPVKFKINYKFYRDEELKNLLDTSINSIVLCVTENCNLRCEYCCYAEKYQNSNYRLKNMPEKVAFKAIDFLMENSKEKNKVYIGFYGGEPFLRFDLISNCVDYCNKKYPFKTPQYTTTTNALLLDNNDTIDFLIKNQFEVLISLDGTKESHDEDRVDKNQKPSFDRVFENLNRIYKRDPHFFKHNISFSAVKTPINYSTSQYNFLDNLCKSSVLIAKVNGTKHFEDILKEKLKFCNTKKVDEHKFSFVKNSILIGQKKYHNALRYENKSLEISPGSFCIPGIKKNFINTEGKIFVCEKVNEENSAYAIGDIFKGIEFSKIKNLYETTTRNVEKCKSCWASRLSSFCFKDIFSLTDEHCEQCSEEVYSNLRYYIEKVKNNCEITTYLENLSTQ